MLLSFKALLQLVYSSYVSARIAHLFRLKLPTFCLTRAVYGNLLYTVNLAKSNSIVLTLFCLTREQAFDQRLGRAAKYAIGRAPNSWTPASQDECRAGSRKCRGILHSMCLCLSDPTGLNCAFDSWQAQARIFCRTPS